MRETPEAMKHGIEEAEIWQASAREADAAFDLVREYFEAALVVSREDRREFLKAYFGKGRGLWLARIAGESAGCVALRPWTPPGEPHLACAEMKRLYVRDRFRGRGIAQRLLETAETFARQAGYVWIYLDTMAEMVTAARLYERNGYERCARYNENPQAAIFMRKNLTSSHASG